MSLHSKTLFEIISDIYEQGVESQADINEIIRNRVSKLQTVDFVETQNLAVKVQQAFKNFLFGAVSR